MEKLNIIERIPVILPERDIFFRLKFNIHKTEVDDEQRKKILSVINSGFSACEPRGVWLRDDIESNSGTSVVFGSGVEFKSKSVCDLLSGSHAAVFMGVTVGPAVIDLASSAVNIGDGASAVIFDAVGSETAEAAIEWLNRYIAQQIKRRGEILTSMRFSAGYGDFLLENQRHFFELLKLEDLGIKLTDRYIFIPEKTVTAVAGIKI